jgi:hypothetical protein
VWYEPSHHGREREVERRMSENRRVDGEEHSS